MSTNSNRGEVIPLYSFTPPQFLYTTKAVKQGEAAAIAQQQQSLDTLLLRAGQALFQLLQDDGPKRALWILTGPGNNGADGWVVARLAAQAGWPVRVFAAKPHSALAKQAQAALLQACPQLSIAPLNQLPVALQQDPAPATIVDALFGAGLNRPLSAECKMLVQAVNHWRDGLTYWVAAPVVAVDLPTGLAADSGEVFANTAIVADLTLTMVAAKVGLYTGAAAQYRGRVALAELGIAEEFARQTTAVASLTDYLPDTYLPERHPLGNRRADSHKGQHGHLLIIGGAEGMAGAVALAGMAALRSGAGKVTLATAAANRSALHSQQPEWLVAPLAETPAQLHATLAALWTPHVVLGPGLGRSEWAQQLVQYTLALAAAQPTTLMLDADALYALAQTPEIVKQLPAGTVLTPHPKEAARLLQTTTIEPNRLHTARALVQLAPQVIWVLKGAGTLVVTGAENDGAPQLSVNYSGCAALASAGSGDVLAGLIGSILAQQQPTTLAERLNLVKFAVWAHGYAAQLAAVDGERGTIASDLLAPLRRLMNPAGPRR